MNNKDVHQLKVEAGDVEKVKASEEVNRRNIQAVIQHSNMTRKMLLELKTIVDALQNNMIAQSKQLAEMRKQLAILQQEFYKRGTTSYSNDNGD